MVTRRRLAAVCLLILSSAAFAQAPDVVLDAATNLLSRATEEKAPEGQKIRIALKSLRDPALVPLFASLRKSDDPRVRVDAMIAVVMATKDPAQLDVKALLSLRDPNSGGEARIGAALAQLIDNDVITNAQLEEIIKAQAVDAGNQVVAACELARRKALQDRSALTKFLTRNSIEATRQDILSHYAAVTLLEDSDAVTRAAALKCLNDMADAHSPRLEGVQELMLIKVLRDKIDAAAPWVEKLARDEQNRLRIRQAAVSALLALGKPAGGEVLSLLIAARKDVTEQIALGLVAIEFAGNLKSADVANLGLGRSGQPLNSQLLKNIAEIARKAVAGGKAAEPEITRDIEALIAKGQPIVLNWALGYSATAPAERKLLLRVGIIQQSSVLDDVRGADYDRAAVAAQRLIEECGEDGRKALARLLRSNSRATVEATLLGLLRSNAKDLADLVLPVYPELTRTNESAANFAALLLAREGRKDALPWLAGMVQGGTVEDRGLRALAAWQYVKLKDQAASVLKRLTAK